MKHLFPSFMKTGIYAILCSFIKFKLLELQTQVF